MKPSRPLPAGFAKEYRLHEQLKLHYASDADRIEVEVEGCIVDVVSGDRLIEIQTASFSSLRRKLAKLLPNYRVTVVFPVPVEKWIVRLSTPDRHEVRRRRSPKSGRWIEVFKHLPYVAQFLAHRHFSLEVVLTKENEFRINDGHGSWRRGGVRTVERELIEVVGKERFAGARSYGRVLPDELIEPFTSRELANALDISMSLAQKVMYSLRCAGTARVVGKRGNARLYATKALRKRTR